MNPEQLEVFCHNKECGDTHIVGGLVPAGTQKYRRMNYMGKTDISFLTYVLNRLIIGWSPLIGTNHLFTCPVCGTERSFCDKRGILIENHS